MATTTSDSSKLESTGRRKARIFHECESSIHLSISRSVYKAILAAHKDAKLSSIFYYSNGARKADDVIQIKKTISRTNIMHIHYCSNNKVLFIPIARTSSHEMETMIPQNTHEIDTVIVRHVVCTRKEKLFTMRIAVEYVNKSGGPSHQISAEIEYDTATYHYYQSLMSMEKILVNDLMGIFGDVIEKIKPNSIYGFLAHHYICTVPSRVFTMFNSGGYIKNKNEVKTYKWDGFKGRFYIIGDRLYWYDDMHNVIETEAPVVLREFEYIFFQVEIMNTTVVIVDILGGYVGPATTPKNLYMPDPLDVLSFFHRLRLKWAADNIPDTFELDLKKLGRFKVFTQFHLKKSSPKAKDLDLPYDGYIITGIGRTYKYKVPTLDARFRNGALHLDKMGPAITSQIFKKSTTGENYINNAIYEISPNLKSDNPNEGFKILKLRYDRKFTSTQENYESFLREIEFFKLHGEETLS